MSKFVTKNEWTKWDMTDLNGDGAANTSDLLMMLSLGGAVCN